LEGGQIRWDKKTTPHKQRLFSTEHVHALFFLKICNYWWKRQTDITISIWTHLMKGAPYCLMYLFLSIIVLMGYNQQDTFKIYWSRLEQFFTAFYFTKAHWNKGVSFIHSSVCILVITKLNLVRHMKIIISYGKQNYFWWAQWCIC
jgi:hypothetical protein